MILSGASLLTKRRDRRYKILDIRYASILTDLISSILYLLSFAVRKVCDNVTNNLLTQWV